MLNRVVMLRPLASRMAQNVNVLGVRKYHADDKPFKWASMDELPLPQGSWQEYYNKNQTRYNLQLAGGIIFFIFTFAVAEASGALFLNAFPPEEPKDAKYD